MEIEIQIRQTKIICDNMGLIIISLHYDNRDIIEKIIPIRKDFLTNFNHFPPTT